MKLTAQVKLLPTPEQAQALRETLERANAAAGLADHIAAINIGRRGAVSRPYASDASLQPAAPGANAQVL